MGVHLGPSLPTDPNSRSALGGIDAFGGGLGDALGKGFTGLIQGIGDALRGIFEPGGIFSPVGEAAQQIRDGQLDLNGRVDLLSPIQDYGSVFMPAGREIKGPRTLPFTEQLGPMRGCSKSSMGIRLDDIGLWDIRAQITVSWVRIVTSDVNWRVIVYRPNGTIYSQQLSSLSGNGNMTGTIVSSVVIDTPGCYVEVKMDYIGTGRGILGGPGWTRLVAQHISRKVDGEWARGTEKSDTASQPGEG